VPQLGRVHRYRLGPTERAEPGDGEQRREEDRAERVDVRERVQRDPPRPLGGVVAEEQGHDPVADLVQDDREEQAAEEDETLFDVSAQAAGCWLSGASTRSRCTGARSAWLR